MKIGNTSGATNNSTTAKVADNPLDKQIQSLQKQKESVQEQIQMTKQNKEMDSKQKAQLLAEYEQQVAQIETQIMQLKAEKNKPEEKKEENTQPTAKDTYIRSEEASQMGDLLAVTQKTDEFKQLYGLKKQITNQIAIVAHEAVTSHSSVKRKTEEITNLKERKSNVEIHMTDKIKELQEKDKDKAVENKKEEKKEEEAVGIDFLA